MSGSTRRAHLAARLHTGHHTPGTVEFDWSGDDPTAVRLLLRERPTTLAREWHVDRTLISRALWSGYAQGDGDIRLAFLDRLLVITLLVDGVCFTAGCSADAVDGFLRETFRHVGIGEEERLNRSRLEQLLAELTGSAE